MSLNPTLQKVESDIQKGDYGKARDRLHGLLATYPDELLIRQKLGDVYWKLHFPAMAGRYWYLEENKTVEMGMACKAFESHCGNDPMQMLFAMKFRGDFRLMEEQYGGRILLKLHEEAKKKHKYYSDFRKQKVEKFVRYPKRNQSRNVFSEIGCWVTFLVIFGILMIGLYTIVKLLFMTLFK